LLLFCIESHADHHDFLDFSQWKPSDYGRLYRDSAGQHRVRERLPDISSPPDIRETEIHFTESKGESRLGIGSTGRDHYEHRVRQQWLKRATHIALRTHPSGDVFRVGQSHNRVNPWRELSKRPWRDDFFSLSYNWFIPNLQINDNRLTLV
jgi:hypothetical protein